MFTNVFPTFEKGRILKKEMLENLRDYPRSFFDVYFNDYCDGIIKGVEILSDEEYITVTKGIVKFSNKLYMLEENFRKLKSDFPIGKEVMLKVKFFDKSVQGDFIYSNTNILSDENMELTKDEMELGRFKLNKNLVLRTEYENFEDFSSEDSTLNIINTKYSGRLQSTLAPKILQCFSKELLASGSENVYDVAFAMQCINNGVIDRSTIIYYISKKLGDNCEDLSNLELYEKLGSIIRRKGPSVKNRAPAIT